MFARRHPVLFSLLVMWAIGAIVIISIALLFFLGKSEPSLSFGEKVGVVEIKGVITDPKPVLAHLRSLRRNKDIKAIVLRINSPGGAVGPSQEIYEEVKKTTRVKTVVASMGAVAASGGYYVGAAADHVMANPGTITGSIGVIAKFPNVEELFKKIGISANVLKSGEYKDVGSPLRKMTDEEKELLQSFLGNLHEQFIRAVAEGRKIPEEKVRAIADGRILTGEDAKKLGLLDSLGNLEDAITLAAKLAGIEGEPSVFYVKEKKFSLLEYIFGSSLTEMLGEITSEAFHYGYLWTPARE